MPRSHRSNAFGISRIRWYPILAAAVVADVNIWYSASTGTTKGDSLGIGFFAVFALGGLRRWISGRDRFHLAVTAGAIIALVMTIEFHDLYRSGGICLPAYAAFILSCVLGSVLSHRSKKTGKIIVSRSGRDR